MRNKDFAIVYLYVLCATLLFATLYFAFHPQTKVVKVEKKVPIGHYTIDGTKNYLLKLGVSDAWVNLDKIHKKKADCFSTILLNKSTFSYCELR